MNQRHSPKPPWPAHRASCVPTVQELTEDTTRGALGFLENARGFAAGDFAPQKDVAQEMRDGFGGAGAGGPAFSEKEDAFLHRIDVEQGGHELYLVDRRAEEKAAET